MLSRLEGVFGNVATGESILQEFYTASQKADESDTAWGLRIKEILQKTVIKGNVKNSDTNEMLKNIFWKNLRNDRLKNATRAKFESTQSFELLRKAVRAEEYDMKSNEICAQLPEMHENKQQDTSLINQLMSRISELEKQMKDNSDRRGLNKIGPRIVSLQKIGTSQRVPVRIYNMSAKVLHIKPNSDLSELHDVKVLRHIDPISSDIKKAQINQQSTSVIDKEDLPEGINLGDASISEEEKSQLSQFLGKWKHIFSTSFTDLGNCDLVKHKINLTDDQPIKKPPRRIPPALYTEVKEHLVEMIEAGAVRPSHSPYSSNIVLARKKDGSLRFYVDFCKLNNKTVKDAYASPRIKESLHLLAGAKYFSKLDLRSGYWQVEIEEEDKEKTAFQMGGLGFYEFNRVPFGLCNAPATFHGTVYGGFKLEGLLDLS